MLDDDESVLAAMRAGARGYVPKGAGQEELLAAIRAVAAGGAVFGAAVAGRMLAALDRTPAPAFPGLTDRESQVLSLMAEGWDNRRIAAELQVSAKTVANHVSHVLTKLQARDRVEAVLRAAPRAGPFREKALRRCLFPEKAPQRSAGRAGRPARARRPRRRRPAARAMASVKESQAASGGTPSASAICSQLAPPRRAARIPISWLSWALRATTSPRASSSSAS